MNERPIPPAALRDANAVEMLRVWLAEQGLHCSLNVGMHSEMGIVEEDAWGALLAEAARQVARALSTESRLDERVVLDNIRARLLAELERPSADPRGGLKPS